MKVKKKPGTYGKVFLPTSFIRKHSLEETFFLTLKVGSLVRKVVCVPTDDAVSEAIYISEDVSAELNLPEHLSYEIFVRDRELHIGPVLGLLVSTKEEYMTPKRLAHYLLYVQRYQEVKGLIIAFTREGILDQERKVIGCAYDPHTHSWIRGVYVFPGAVYIRRAYINLKTHDRLLKLVGDRFFNSYAFDKWEMWKWLSCSETVRGCLPDTVLLERCDETFKLLNKYKKIYLKPTRGYQGLGIYRVEKSERKFTLKYGKGNQNSSEVFETWEDLYRYLTVTLDMTSYIAQQMVDIIKVDGRIMDLRAIVQKGKSGTWLVQGIISRQGPKESIVSNISRGGNAENAWKTLLTYYSMDEAAALAKWSQICKLVLEACQQLERTGLQYGNLGVDVAIDTDGDLWIIEINNIYPDHSIALDANETVLYKTVMSTPLLYLKWLADFR